jgi:hypothetical protein
MTPYSLVVIRLYFLCHEDRGSWYLRNVSFNMAAWCHISENSMLKQLHVFLNFLKISDTPFVVQKYGHGCRDTKRIGETICVYREKE